MSEPHLTHLENLIITKLAKRGLISLFYGTLMSQEKESLEGQIRSMESRYWRGCT